MPGHFKEQIRSQDGIIDQEVLRELSSVVVPRRDCLAPISTEIDRIKTYGSVALSRGISLEGIKGCGATKVLDQLESKLQYYKTPYARLGVKDYEEPESGPSFKFIFSIAKQLGIDVDGDTPIKDLLSGIRQRRQQEPHKPIVLIFDDIDLANEYPLTELYEIMGYNYEYPLKSKGTTIDQFLISHVSNYLASFGGVLWIITQHGYFRFIDVSTRRKTLQHLIAGLPLDAAIEAIPQQYKTTAGVEKLIRWAHQLTGGYAAAYQAVFTILAEKKGEINTLDLNQYRQEILNKIDEEKVKKLLLLKDEAIRKAIFTLASLDKPVSIGELMTLCRDVLNEIGDNSRFEWDLLTSLPFRKTVEIGTSQRYSVSDPPRTLLASIAEVLSVQA
jgi:hypothetical protein